MRAREFNQWLEENRNCVLADGSQCPMRGRGQFVGVDAVSGQVSRETVLFLGLNPGVEEAKIGLPFVGPSGRFLREQIEKADVESWAMANSLLCSSQNETSIYQANKARSCCHGNLALIFRKFLPRIIVPCGNGALSLFKVDVPITTAAENFFVSRGPSGKSAPVLVIPIFHPSALIRSGGEASTKFPGFFKRLQAIAKLEAACELAERDRRDGVEAAINYLEERRIKLRRCFSN